MFLAFLYLFSGVNAWMDDPLDAAPLEAACGGWGPEPCAFGDNTVLASATAWRGGVTPARIFGEGTSGEEITITGLPTGTVVLPSNPFTVPSSGNWSITLSSPDSPLFFNLTFAGLKNSVTLRNVRFGLTWLCSGQSNMDMCLDNCFYANETVAVSQRYSDVVFKHSPSGSWTPVGTDEKGLRAFSAVCLFTALHLKDSLPALKDVPIGIVQSSVGGTTIESWMSAEALATSGVIDHPQCGFKGGCSGQAYCGNYNPLILPLAPYTFKSMSWYQGESNVACNDEQQGYYAKLLPALVTSWRMLFQTNFSAFIVMLAPQGRTDETPMSRSSDAYPVMRATQLSVLKLPGTSLIYPIDMGDDGKTVYTPPSSRHGDIHPRNKTEFGRRLALAYAQVEGILPAGISGSGPVLTGSQLAPDGQSVLLSFESGLSGKGLQLSPTADCYTFGRAGPGNTTRADCCQNNRTDPRSPHGYPFELQAGGDWTLAEAAVESGGTQVRLVPAQCGNGCSGWGQPLSGKVRYAFDAWPLCVLSNEQALPLPPFSN